MPFQYTHCYASSDPFGVATPTDVHKTMALSLCAVPYVAELAQLFSGADAVLMLSTLADGYSSQELQQSVRRCRSTLRSVQPAAR